MSIELRSGRQKLNQGAAQQTGALVAGLDVTGQVQRQRLQVGKWRAGQKKTAVGGKGKGWETWKRGNGEPRREGGKRSKP